MAFNTINLAGDRALVKGTDVFGVTNQKVIDASQWLAIKARTEVDGATADYDAAVEEFYAPLTNAIDKLTETRKAKEDSTFYVVLTEAEQGKAPVDEEIVHLTVDSVILRLIEEGNTDRLVWVGNDLEILTEAPQVESSPTITGVFAD